MQEIPLQVNLATPPLALRRDRPYPLPAAPGTVIICRSGAIWITQDHDIRDIVLEPGQRFTLDVNEPAVLQAFDVATVTICPPATTPAH